MNIVTSLMKHQIVAIEKMRLTRIGALFMGLGVGKSLTTIALVHRRLHKIDSAIWLCPVSLKETIRYEILKHTDCTSDDINVFDDKINERNIPNCLWHIIGIESVSGSNRVALALNKLITEKSFVIVDESSYIKGHDAKRTLRITRYAERALYRLILTGTPISQGVIDLYAQMRFLSPKILGYRSFYSFARNHLEYSMKYPSRIVRSHNIPFLTAKIQPYVYQVTKEECLDLPDKLYETRYFSMTEEQGIYYQEAKDEILAELDNDRSDFLNSIIIFRLFTVLQQIVCGFWNYRQDYKQYLLIQMQHNRINTLIDIVKDIPENEKIIIWAKFQYDIRKITEALGKEYSEDSVALFYGGLSEKKRAEQIEQFRKEKRFFVATQSCGGHGLTLNEASHVIYYNNAFKYSERIQSESRNHRIGQEKKVTYIDIQCNAGIDERIAKALREKGSVVEQFKKEVDKTKDTKRLRKIIESL